MRSHNDDPLQFNKGYTPSNWARAMRPWTLMAWSFLTMGILLGSFWAYYELGWGGWWFWDPVENASFMPWLTGTALLHSLIVMEKRDAFRRWTILLAILTFSLSLLGAFLVRSGVLTSVHAFANDPERGLFILIILTSVVGFSLLLYAWRAQYLYKPIYLTACSRESLLLGNNIFLVVSAATVLLGTLYPLLIEALQLGRISVGPPYFNTIFLPLMIGLLFLMGLGPFTLWREMPAIVLFKKIRVLAIISLLLGILLPWIFSGEFQILFKSHFLVILGVTMAIWLIGSVLWNVPKKMKNLSYYGMALAHIGVAVTTLGITVSTQYSTEMDVAMKIGDTVSVGPYIFQFQHLTVVQGPNYEALQANVLVTDKQHKKIDEMIPEKRFYTAREIILRESAIASHLFRDRYVVLGDYFGDEEKTSNPEQWSFRIYYKPLVRWIWYGAVLMALGGLIAAISARGRAFEESPD